MYGRDDDVEYNIAEAVKTARTAAEVAAQKGVLKGLLADTQDRVKETYSYEEVKKLTFKAFRMGIQWERQGGKDPDHDAG